MPDNQEQMDKARRQQQINDFMKSPCVANFMFGRKKELETQTKEMLKRDANKALDYVDAENKARLARGEKPLPEEYSQLSILNGVVDTVYGHKVKKEGIIDVIRAGVEAGKGFGD